MEHMLGEAVRQIVSATARAADILDENKSIIEPT